MHACSWLVRKTSLLGRRQTTCTPNEFPQSLVPKNKTNSGGWHLWIYSIQCTQLTKETQKETHNRKRKKRKRRGGCESEWGLTTRIADVGFRFFEIPPKVLLIFLAPFLSPFHHALHNTPNPNQRNPNPTFVFFLFFPLSIGKLETLTLRWTIVFAPSFRSFHTDLIR